MARLFEKDPEVIKELVDLVAGPVPSKLQSAGLRMLQSLIQTQIKSVTSMPPPPSPPSCRSTCTRTDPPAFSDLRTISSPLPSPHTHALTCIHADFRDPPSISIPCIQPVLILVRVDRVSLILAALGASLPHGYLPSTLRSCASTLQHLSKTNELSMDLMTGVFTLAQLLTNFAPGCEALLASGCLATLMPLIANPGVHYKFSTRAGRIIEMMLHSCPPSHAVLIDLGLLDAIVKRLAAELVACDDDSRSSLIGNLHKEQPLVLTTSAAVADDLGTTTPAHNTAMDVSMDLSPPVAAGSPADGAAAFVVMDTSTDGMADPGSPSGAGGGDADELDGEPVVLRADGTRVATCSLERKSLLKILLKLLYTTQQEPAFATPLRNIVESALPGALERIIRNPIYFGSTLWNAATKWVTDYCNSEPNLLPALQDAGLQDAVLDVLSTAIPVSAEVLAELPNLLAAVCLNQRGLDAFTSRRCLGKLFGVLVLPQYQAQLGCPTPGILGSAMDELLRHQPTLRDAALFAFSQVLRRIEELGKDPTVVVITGSCAASAFPHAGSREDVVIK